MSKVRRHRTPIAKDGELKVGYSRLERGEPLDICYVWGDGVSKSDGSLLHYAFGHADVREGRSLVDELVARGYDISTLKFSISKMKVSDPK